MRFPKVTCSFGGSLGGAGVHIPKSGEAKSSPKYGPCSSIEERSLVKRVVAGASPVVDPNKTKFCEKFYELQKEKNEK